jgi:hypothetical protein
MAANAACDRQINIAIFPVALWFSAGDALSLFALFVESPVSEHFISQQLFLRSALLVRLLNFSSR